MAGTFQVHDYGDHGDRASANRSNNVARRLKQYGLTLEDYAKLRAKQGGRCAICSATKPGGGKAMWSIDHDHSCCPHAGSCGKCVRGLLCNKCNTGLGMFNDSVESLEAAIKYLQK